MRNKTIDNARKTSKNPSNKQTNKQTDKQRTGHTVSLVLSINCIRAHALRKIFILKTLRIGGASRAIQLHGQ